MISVSSLEPVDNSVNSPSPWEQGFEWQYANSDNGMQMGFYKAETGEFIPAEDNMELVKEYERWARGKILL